jgi:peptide/nickel transport system substrate-binding protein
MNKLVSITAVLALIIAMTAPVFAMPPIARPNEIIAATIEGGSIPTVDPSACYDTASAAIIFLVYDNLVTFDGEHMDRYLPALATEWTIKENVPAITDPLSGIVWHWTYTFKMREGVKFHNGATLTAGDVEYTIERGMIMEAGDNPQWMFYEPLLNGAAASYINLVEYDPDNVEADAIFVGKAIDSCVESNATHVWFNIAFDGSYAPFMQILTQSWAAILNKQWVLDLGRANWDGNWGDYTDWVAFHYPATPPLDDPTPAVMGTGPFEFGNLDSVLMYWDVNRFVNYWRGWGSGPAPNYGVGWPAFGGSKPAGYIDHYKLTWAYAWEARSTMFLNGEVDFCSVPTQYKDQIIGQDNIRVVYPLPSLAVGVAHYQFDIRPTSPYGPIYEYGIINEDGVPRDFFGNASYGVYIRKAFSHCIDFPTYLDTVFLGEAIQPPTAMIPTLPYYNATIPKYDYDLTAAAALFHQWPGLWDTGFSIKLSYNIGNLARQILCEMLAASINSLNPKFHATALGLDWASFMSASNGKQLPVFTVGWLADYPDGHNFAYPYYYTYGTYAARQGFSDATLDGLIEDGIATPDGPARGAIYSQIQQRVIDLCPSIALYSAIARHYEQTWINGWYYNPIYPDLYVANLWKWYYTPQAQSDAVPSGAAAGLLPYDVNYDGKTNMVDIGVTAASFGTIYGPPMSAKWVYRADFNNDRKVDMKDIGGVAKNFGKITTAWAPA